MYCECGCGEKTPLAIRNDWRGRYKKGEPLRYIYGHQSRKSAPQYRVDPDTQCWIWLWSRNNKGYGLVRDPAKGRMTVAHRFYFEKLKGPIPDGWQIDHLCRNRACVNPDHLDLVTPKENTERGVRLHWGNRYGKGKRR